MQPIFNSYKGLTMHCMWHSETRTQLYSLVFMLFSHLQENITIRFAVTTLHGEAFFQGITCEIIAKRNHSDQI